MAIVQALLAAIARSAGRIMNTAVGWATAMIFGKVPEKRQIYVTIMTFGSIVWIAVVIGIAFPRIGTFLLSFVPVPKWVDARWIRIAMLIAAVVVPALVGAVSLLLKDPEDRPWGTGKMRAVLRGYPFTLGLAITLLMMCVFAPIMKLRTLSRRWTTQHIPVIVESKDYEPVLDHLQQVLSDRGWRTERRRASWMVRVPTRVLTLLGGRTLDDYVARELATLESERFELILHPSDLVVNGVERDIIHVRALLAEQLAFGRAHLAWTKEGQALEDAMRRLHARLQPSSSSPDGLDRGLDEVDARLRDLDVAYDEWDVLFREKLLLQLATRDARRSRHEERAETRARRWFPSIRLLRSS